MNLPEEGFTQPPLRDMTGIPLVEGFYAEPDGDMEGIRTLDKNGNLVRIASFFAVTGLTRTAHGEDWGRLLEWKDKDGRPHRWNMSEGMAEGDPREITRTLASGGVTIARGYRQHLVDYIMASDADFVLLTDRLGWHGD